jgi:hypothetical protein
MVKVAQALLPVPILHGLWPHRRSQPGVAVLLFSAAEFGDATFAQMLFEYQRLGWHGNVYELPGWRR